MTHEIDPAIAALSDTEIVLEFRQALVALLPSCVRLQMLGSDDQPYDPFEDLASALWDHLVANSFEWKYGSAISSLPYDVLQSPAPPYVIAHTSAGVFAFSAFGASREFGEDPWNGVWIFSGGDRQLIPLQDINGFELRRG